MKQADHTRYKKNRYLPVSCTFFLSLWVSVSVCAESFSLEAGENNLNLIYQQTAIYDLDAPLVTNTQLLYSRQKNHQDLFASAGLTAYSGGNPGLGMGFKIIAADPLDYYLSAMALGVNLLYQSALPRTGFETCFYYAGDGLTISDGKSISLFKLNMDYEIRHELLLRLGYRNIKVRLIDGLKADFNRGFYLGLSWLY